VLRSCALFLGIALLPSSALATAFQIEARTEAQVASIRAWRGTNAETPVLLPRRRLVQYLGLNGYELIPNVAIGFESSIRVFADFGLPHGESARLDGMRSEDADLLFANVVYRGDNLSVRVGRQLYTDIMDLMAFDGAHVRYVHRFGGVGVGAELYGGLWVKAGSLLGSSVYQPDGIRESDLRRSTLDPVNVQAYGALDDIEPVIGAKLLLENLAGVSAGVGFRQSWLSGMTDVRRLGAELKWSGLFGITALAALDYDLLLSRVANARWTGRIDREELSFALEYLRVSPVLSADSIFLYFAHAPRDEARARFDWFPVGPLRIYVQLVGDLYGTELNETLATAAYVQQGDASSPLAYGGGGGATLRLGAFRLAADATVKAGWGGRQLWVDLNGGYAPPQGPFSAEARLSVANITDPMNARLKGTYVGFQAFVSYALTRTSRLSLVFEQNFGPATRSDTKLFAMFDLKAVFGGRRAVTPAAEAPALD
jgi:hypothetical protein